MSETPQRRKADQPHASDWEHDASRLETVRDVLKALITLSMAGPLSPAHAAELTKKLNDGWKA